MAFRVREGKGGGLEVVEMTETPSSVLKQYDEREAAADECELLCSTTNAQPILARLNHQQHQLRRSLVGPLDVVLKLGAYKAFSEVSPVAHFLNFTSNQALLDAFSTTGGNIHIHILDFDIGLGAQWASLLHDLKLRCPSATLRITAFFDAANNSPLELAILHDTLGSFAGELGVPFHLDALAVEALPLLRPSPGELLAVSLPAWSADPGLLRLLRHLSPTILVCSHSHDAQAAPSPGYHLAAAGFAPLPLSAFAHAQAECLLTRSPAAGFHVDNRHAELALCWHHRPIVSVSAWACSS